MARERRPEFVDAGVLQCALKDTAPLSHMLAKTANTVHRFRLMLSTHDWGGLSERDIKMATFIDSIL